MNFNINKSIVRFSISFLILFFSNLPSFAHVREWLLTYPYWTPPQGQAELEQWHNAGDNPSEAPEEWLELEYGVTNRYSTSLYLTRFAGNFQHKGWKWENIYRLANPGEFVVDPAIYLEYVNRDGVHKPAELEGKLILQKYLGSLAIATNLVWERELKAGHGIEFARYHLAVSHPLGGSLATAGLEFSHYNEGKFNTLTPVISASLGHNLKVLAGWEFPLSQPADGTASGRLRTLVEWEFSR